MSAEIFRLSKVREVLRAPGSFIQNEDLGRIYLDEELPESLREQALSLLRRRAKRVADEERRALLETLSVTSLERIARDLKRPVVERRDAIKQIFVCADRLIAKKDVPSCVERGRLYISISRIAGENKDHPDVVGFERLNKWACDAFKDVIDELAGKKGADAWDAAKSLISKADRSSQGYTRLTILAEVFKNCPEIEHIYKSKRRLRIVRRQKQMPTPS